MTPPQGNPATQEFKWEDCADRRASLESRCLLGLYFIYPLRNASSSGMAGGSPGITTRGFFCRGCGGTEFWILFMETVGGALIPCVSSSFSSWEFQPLFFQKQSPDYNSTLSYSGPGESGCFEKCGIITSWGSSSDQTSRCKNSHLQTLQGSTSNYQGFPNLKLAPLGPAGKETPLLNHSEISATVWGGIM